MSDVIGIRKYDFVEFYVGSVKMVAYWFARALTMMESDRNGVVKQIFRAAGRALDCNDIAFAWRALLCSEIVKAG